MSRRPKRAWTGVCATMAETRTPCFALAAHALAMLQSPGQTDLALPGLAARFDPMSLATSSANARR